MSYPPLTSDKGTPLLAQNRQFQWFSEPTYIYPMIPAYAATILKNAGHEVIWDDGIAEELKYETWLHNVQKDSPEIIALETKTPVIKKHWSIIQDIKDNIPDVKVVLIGDHVTALPRESFNKSKVDFVITGGDFDFLLNNLLDHLEVNRDLEPGIFFRKKGEISSNGPFQLDHDLNSLPIIDRELTKWELYSEKNGNFKKTPGTYTMIGRDCWWNKCTFCAWTVMCPTYRVGSPEKLSHEIDILKEKYGMKDIFDDTGTFPIGRWLKKFCKMAIKKRYKDEINLGCNMRFGALNFENYKMMKHAGFKLLLFGVESANQKTLDKLNKNTTVQEIKKSCMNASKAGLEPHVTIMFGYPWESEEEAKKTVDLGKYLLRKGFAKTVQATIMIPYPGTPLFKEATEKGWLRTLDWSEYDMKEPILKTSVQNEIYYEMIQELFGVAFDPEFLIRRVLSIRSIEDLKFSFRAAKKVIGHLKDFSP